MRTRFAPSPTGDLHVGGVWVALASWVLARRARARGPAGGAFVVRIDDLDRPRVVAGAADRILDDLASLGLSWDEGPRRGGPYGPYVQSARVALYEDALLALTARGLVYPCDCSRSELARAASAPHAGEELKYPGTCRDADPQRSMTRPPALRFRIPEGARVTFVEGGAPRTEAVADAAGDFVLRRADGVFAYQLATAVDDGAMAIDLVVRGADLASSTARQVALMEALGGRPPSYLHLPLVTTAAGERVAKRAKGATVRELLSAGVGAEALVGTVAWALGLAPDDGPRCAEAVAGAGGTPLWPAAPWALPAAWSPAP